MDGFDGDAPVFGFFVQDGRVGREFVGLGHVDEGIQPHFETGVHALADALAVEAARIFARQESFGNDPVGIWDGRLRDGMFYWERKMNFALLPRYGPHVEHEFEIAELEFGHFEARFSKIPAEQGQGVGEDVFVNFFRADQAAGVVITTTPPG